MTYIGSNGNGIICYLENLMIMANDETANGRDDCEMAVMENVIPQAVN